MVHVRPTMVAAAARWLLGLASKPSGLTPAEHEAASMKAGMVLRAREQQAARIHAKDEPSGPKHAAHARKKEAVHVAAVLDDGTIVLARPDPTGTYADGEHVRLAGVEFPKVETFPAGDPRNKLPVNVEARSLMAAIVAYLRGKTPGLEGEGIVDRKFTLVEVAERTDKHELQGDLTGLPHESHGYTIGHRDFSLVFTLTRLFPALHPGASSAKHQGSPPPPPLVPPPLAGGPAGAGIPLPHGGAVPPEVRDAIEKMALRAEYLAKQIGEGEKGKKPPEVTMAKEAATRTATALRHLSEKPENAKAQGAVLADGQELSKAAALLAAGSDDRANADEVATLAAQAYQLASKLAPVAAPKEAAEALAADIDEVLHLLPTEAKELHKLASHLATTLRHGNAAKIAEASTALAHVAKDLPADSLELGITEAVLADAAEAVGAALPVMGAAPMAGGPALTEEERRVLHDAFAAMLDHLKAMPRASALRPLLARLALAVHLVLQGRGGSDAIQQATDQLEQAAGLFPESSTDRLHAQAAIEEARKLAGNAGSTGAATKGGAATEK